MRTPEPVPAHALIYMLIGAGVEVRRGPEAPSTSVILADGSTPDRLRLLVEPGEGVERLQQLLDRAGYRHETVADGVEVDLVQRGMPRPEPRLLLQFQLPLRLPTLNPQLRMHHTTRTKEIRALAWEVVAAVPPRQRPARPLTNVEVEIDRYCSNEPDQENLDASAKWLLDVLQPLDLARRPYGLGIILEDAKWCVRDLRVRHVPSRKALTRVRIYESTVPPVERSAQC